MDADTFALPPTLARQGIKRKISSSQPSVPPKKAKVDDTTGVQQEPTPSQQQLLGFADTIPGGNVQYEAWGRFMQQLIVYTERFLKDHKAVDYDWQNAARLFHTFTDVYLSKRRPRSASLSLPPTLASIGRGNVTGGPTTGRGEVYTDSVRAQDKSRDRDKRQDDDGSEHRTNDGDFDNRSIQEVSTSIPISARGRINFQEDDNKLRKSQRTSAQQDRSSIYDEPGEMSGLEEEEAGGNNGGRDVVDSDDYAGGDKEVDDEEEGAEDDELPIRRRPTRGAASSHVARVIHRETPYKGSSSEVRGRLGRPKKLWDVDFFPRGSLEWDQQQLARDNFHRDISNLTTGSKGLKLDPKLAVNITNFFFGDMMGRGAVKRLRDLGEYYLSHNKRVGDAQVAAVAHELSQDASIPKLFRRVYVSYADAQLSKPTLPIMHGVIEVKSHLTLLSRYKRALRGCRLGEDTELVGFCKSKMLKPSGKGKDWRTPLAKYFAQSLKMKGKSEFQKTCYEAGVVRDLVKMFGEGILCILPPKAMAKLYRWGSQLMRQVFKILEKYSGSVLRAVCGYLKRKIHPYIGVKERWREGVGMGTLASIEFTGEGGLKKPLLQYLKDVSGGDTGPGAEGAAESEDESNSSSSDDESDSGDEMVTGGDAEALVEGDSVAGSDVPTVEAGDGSGDEADVDERRTESGGDRVAGGAGEGDVESETEHQGDAEGGDDSAEDELDGYVAGGGGEGDGGVKDGDESAEGELDGHVAGGGGGGDDEVEDVDEPDLVPTVETAGLADKPILVEEEEESDEDDEYDSDDDT